MSLVPEWMDVRFIGEQVEKLWSHIQLAFTITLVNFNRE